MKNQHRLFTGLAVAGALMATGCSASYHAEKTQGAMQGDRVTVGTVQKEIKKGMSGSEVAAVLGSPNIVSTDESGWEVWVYDKISSDVVYSQSSFIIGVGSKSASQRTLTIIIKFDDQKKVRDFAYHTSRF